MKKTQKEKIHNLLKTGRWVKVQAMQRIAWRYGHVLWLLRNEGIQMEKRRQKKTRLEEWRIV
jgi:hypothetical protein